MKEESLCVKLYISLNRYLQHAIPVSRKPLSPNRSPQPPRSQCHACSRVILHLKRKQKEIHPPSQPASPLLLVPKAVEVVVEGGISKNRSEKRKKLRTAPFLASCSPPDASQTQKRRKAHVQQKSREKEKSASRLWRLSGARLCIPFPRRVFRQNRRNRNAMR